MRAVYFILGFLTCAYKGAKLPFLALIPGIQNKEDKLEHWGGLTDPRLDYIIRNIRAAPWGNKPHHLTDLVVEWNRLDAQRGAKFFAALIVVTWLIHWIL